MRTTVSGVGSLTSVSEDNYRTVLDNKLSLLAREPGATLRSVIRGACGAFPTIVLERLNELGLADSIPLGSEIRVELNKGIMGPELHLLDFEWYFTKKTSEDLADILANRTKNLLCLSAPTVAAAICSRQHRTVLVDRNPLIEYRLGVNKDYLQFIIADITEPLQISNHFEAVFFDPPWYPEFYALWLWQASQVVQIGGLIAFPLFPSLLRSTAERERHEILQAASQLGVISVREGILSYETPLFEQEAIAECGMVIKDSWRNADLVLIEVTENLREPAPLELKFKDNMWETFLVGQQVIKLRRDTCGDERFAFAPVDGCPNYVLPSVTRTDPRRGQIDIWTSRNRVARVGKRDLVSGILRHLASGHGIEELSKDPLISTIDTESRQKLIADLRTIICTKLVE